MARFSELHLKLEELAEKFLKDQTDENSAAIVAEITRLIITDADILIDGIPVEGLTGQVQPGGYTGPDGRFYIHIFSSRIQFDMSGAANPMITKLKSLLDMVFANDAVGGLSLNYKKEKGTILITKEDIMAGLSAAVHNNGGK